ncbi:TPT-domain-containing protein [Auriculariales sp. MPI-PUGE-AT-0066]|nr:TPT-domain-containing protein [Auriculariales sp. MPI-PUGE-AT-0066]
MLPTTSPSSAVPRHNEKVSRGWTAYEDRDDKWRKGTDNSTIAGWAKAARGLVDEANLKESIARVLGRKPPSVSLSGGAPTATIYIPSTQTIRFVLLCGLWYFTSALSSNSAKAIMTSFKYPVTLTFFQFGFIAGYCLLCASPVILGHITSSMAISRIPVSTVHTIKALSPLFTVGAYALLFGVSYSARTYVSLLPLTLGVMLACSFDMSASNLFGLLCAFGSAIIFVSSNIFFKKIMPTGSGTRWQQGSVLRTGDHTSTVMYYFFMNGTVHWAQNVIAFAILANTSPVTYSIASLVKRIVVIVIAIIWFRQAIHPIQGFGIALTFFGLWMYNNAKGDVEKGEHKMRRVEAARDLALPTSFEQVATPPLSEKVPMYSTPQVHAQPGGFRNRGMSIHQTPRPVGVPSAPPLGLGPPTKPRISITPVPESYPSPPLSQDSPPPTLAPSPLEIHGAGLFSRRHPGTSSTPEPLLAPATVTVQ